MLNSFRHLSSVRILALPCRSSSAWLNAARDAEASSTDNVEKLFIDPEIQRLLNDLTGLDLESKVFRNRRTSAQQRSHFALMTETRLANTVEKMREEAKNFLQFVPVKEPRSDSVTVLAHDKEISGFDSSKFVFTDITFDATDQDRTVVVREVDGTLRTATPEEHDRMNRTYYQKPNRPVNPPAVFQDPDLQNSLDRNDHEFVLDWACWFYEPDDPAFVKLSQTIFDRVANSGKFEVLHSTRHFGQLVFYLALNGNIPPLLNHFGGRGRIAECANLIRLQKLLNPNWRSVIVSTDSDEKIVNDFIKQNSRFREELRDLTRFLNSGQTVRDVLETSTSKVGLAENLQVTVTSDNIRSTSGPLGTMSDDYAVKVATSGDKQQTRSNETRGKGRLRNRNRPQKDRREGVDNSKKDE